METPVEDQGTCAMRNPVTAVFAPLLVGGALLGLACGEDEAGPYACPDCNVLLISADTLRADRLGAYGHTRDTSPEIDALASQSLLYEDVTAQAPWTLSSHVSMLTGLYSHRHKVLDRRSRISDETVTLADLLHAEGYTTAAFTGGGYVASHYNYHTFDVFHDGGDVHGANFPEMLRWLEQNADRRFFLFWHDFLAHCPYDPPRPSDLFARADYAGPIDVKPNRKEPLCGEKPSWSCAMKCGAYYSKLKSRLSSEDLEYLLDKYDGNVHHIDRRVGQIFEALEILGLREQTVVIFTSDHGESFLDRQHRGQVGHGILYEEILRVPLVISVPGAPPRRIARPVELVDLMPTVLETLGLEAPPADGRSILPGAEGLEGEEKPVYSEDFYKGHAYSIRHGGFKLIHDVADETWELYDLSTDPRERENLAGTNHPQESRLRSLLRERRPAMVAKGESAEIDSETRAQLRALGYID